MASVLDIGSKARGVKPGRGDGYLRTTKSAERLPSEEEVKPEAPCYKILWQVINYALV
jgi:hypothetical protein